MQYFFTNIEKETLENTDFRRVLFTTPLSQLVVMCLEPGDEIGMEVHTLDQFIRIEKGAGKAILAGDEHVIEDGSAFVIPAGIEHNVLNTATEQLKLYSIYTPPEHKYDTIHKQKESVAEEHFDGVTNLS